MAIKSDGLGRWISMYINHAANCFGGIEKMSVMEPCLSCEHAKEQREEEKRYFCTAFGFNLNDDTKLPMLCTYFTPRN